MEKPFLTEGPVLSCVSPNPPFATAGGRLFWRPKMPNRSLETSSVPETTPVSGVAGYSCVAALRDGRRVEIRALKSEDRSDLLDAVGRTSARSLYRRFFAAKRGFTEKEQAFFLNVDFVDHVALVAVLEEDGRPAIVGGARYVVVQPGKAEVAFVVIDRYQGQTIGATLLHHLAAIARGAGLQELIAEVLPDNVSMLKVFEKSGLRTCTKRESNVVHVALRLS
jgi:RimJ/RimL family protein N-acetyltransferase